MPIVRDATPDDAEDIGEAHAEAWRVGYEGLFPPEALETAVDVRRHMWAGLMAEPVFPDGTLLVEEEAGRVVGFIHFGLSGVDTHVGEVYGFYVHPSFWGTGSAHSLMDRAMASFRHRVAMAMLWTHANAGRARSFYGKSGWSETGNQREESLWDGLTYPAVEYRRELDPT